MRLAKAMLAGACIGILGGLIGLGGAEFRLPILISVFCFCALEAVILNKTMSLVVVLFSLPFRASVVSFGEIGAHWDAILNILGGSLVGAWVGAEWATRLKSTTLLKIISGLLVFIALVLLLGHGRVATGEHANTVPHIIAGVLTGFGIGVVASLLGVAGGELLIPTFVLLFGCNLKLAGSLSLAVSLPTMLVAFARYTKDRSFSVVKANMPFVVAMAIGSIAGAFAGGRLLLGVIPESILMPALAVILLLSAVKTWRHAA